MAATYPPQGVTGGTLPAKAKDAPAHVSPSAPQISCTEALLSRQRHHADRSLTDYCPGLMRPMEAAAETASDRLFTFRARYRRRVSWRIVDSL